MDGLLGMGRGLFNDNDDTKHTMLLNGKEYAF